MKSKYRIFLYPFLILILLAAYLFNNNADNIYARIGDYYNKANKTDKAIYFYEKTLAINNKNYEIRNKYVNLVINSPLTIQSQERLVKIAQDDVEDQASGNAEYFLYNLKREIHNKYPNNYILQAPYNQKIVHWGKMPITYSFKNQYTVPDEYIQAVTDAFNEWERASSCRVKFSQVKINPNIWIEFFKENIDSPKYGEKYVVAYTAPSISQNVLENMVIKLNLLNLDGEQYSPNQIYNTALHEIFHALGFMGHSYEKEDIMHMAKNRDSIEKDTKTPLTSADKLTLELLYKTKPNITNAYDLEYSYVPYLIIGNKEDVYYTKKREAKNYIKKAPTLPNGYIDLADALVLEKHYGEAAKNLEKAYRFAKNNDTKYIILYNLAVAYYYQDLYNLALDYVGSAMEIKNEDELHYLAAEIHLKQENIQAAIQEYEYLINNTPDNIDYAIGLANIYLKEKKYFKARKCLKHYLKNHPQEKNNPKLKSYKKLFL